MIPKSNGKMQYENNSLEIDDALFQNLMEMANQAHQPLNDLVSELLSQAIHHRQQIDGTEARWRELSRREQEIVALYCLGYTSDEIGKRLILSINTIKTHLRNGMQKLGLSNRSELRSALADWDFAGWLKIAPESLPEYSQSYLPLPGFINRRKHQI